MLITYGDLLMQQGKRPLEALPSFLAVFMQGAINTVHILPFFPSSSDRGFAIIDYEEVDPRLGTWEDIDELAGIPADVRRRVQPRLVEEPVVPALPQRRTRVRGLVRRVLDEGRDPPRLPAADPAAAHVEPADAVPHHQRHALRLDDLQPRPGGPQLQERARAAARRRDPALLRAARRRLHPARRGHLHLARAGHELRAPRADARAREAVSRHPRRRGAAARADHRDQRAARRQHRLLRRRHATKRRWSTTSRCRRWCCTRSIRPTRRCWRAGRAALVHVSPTATYFNFLASHDGVGLLGARGILAARRSRLLVESAASTAGSSRIATTATARESRTS